MSEHDMQVVVDTATRATRGQRIDSTVELAAFIVPAGGELEVLDVEERLARYRDTPARKLGTVHLTDAASLVAYVTKHVLPATVLYSNWQTRRIVAVINDHETGSPGWGDHQAVLTLTHTPEWMDWFGRDGTLGTQVQFAEHIEDHTAQIVDPPAADMLELAQTFHASSSVEFKSQNRLSDGQVQLRYEETVSASAGQKGNITIPTTFLLRLAVFEGMESIEVGARLRYRLRNGHLAIGYKLDSPSDIVRRAVDQVVAGIEQATSLTVLRGTPRSG